MGEYMGCARTHARTCGQAIQNSPLLRSRAGRMRFGGRGKCWPARARGQRRRRSWLSRPRPLSRVSIGVGLWGVQAFGGQLCWAGGRFTTCPSPSRHPNMLDHVDVLDNGVGCGIWAVGVRAWLAMDADAPPRPPCPCAHPHIPHPEYQYDHPPLDMCSRPSLPTHTMRVPCARACTQARAHPGMSVTRSLLQTAWACVFLAVIQAVHPPTNQRRASRSQEVTAVLPAGTFMPAACCALRPCCSGEGPVCLSFCYTVARHTELSMPPLPGPSG